MPFTEEGKIFINNLFDLKGYNGKHLVRKFPGKSWNVGLVYQCCKSYRLLGWSTVVPAAADVATPAQLMTLTLLTNCCHTKMATRKIIFAYYT